MKSSLEQCCKLIKDILKHVCCHVFIKKQILSNTENRNLLQCQWKSGPASDCSTFDLHVQGAKGTMSTMLRLEVRSVWLHADLVLRVINQATRSSFSCLDSHETSLLSLENQESSDKRLYTYLWPVLYSYINLLSAGHKLPCIVPLDCKVLVEVLYTRRQLNTICYLWQFLQHRHSIKDLGKWKHHVLFSSFCCWGLL